MRLATLSSFRRSLKQLSEARLSQVIDAMRGADRAYGHPHLHAGIGMRRLGKHMECRDALDYRLVFRRDGDALLFLFYGTHDEVKAFLKNRR
jgi:mRNA-degrading endonuclease YafQ of YafQ-DinJ toxin-antitoxin module